MKYIVTIYDRSTQSTSHFERQEDNIDSLVNKELGGWNNLYRSTTTTRGAIVGEYMMAGTTRDSSKIFSILSIVE